jgi:hypothetical protein
MRSGLEERGLEIKYRAECETFIALIRGIAAISGMNHISRSASSSRSDAPVDF